MVKKPGQRKKKDVLFNEEGNMICPHCASQLTGKDIPKGKGMRKWNYQIKGNVYVFKNICNNCDNYVVTYSDKSLNIIKNFKEEK